MGQSESKRPLLTRWYVGVPIFAAIVGAYVLGTNHVVSSSEGTALVPKIHFTYSETFVSLDAITGMPFIQAKSQYPLTVKALQAKGILETDDAFQTRIENQVSADMQEAQRKIEEQMKAAGY